MNVYVTYPSKLNLVGNAHALKIKTRLNAAQNETQRSAKLSVNVYNRTKIQ